ncbi:hypothetical protein ABPG77_009767 [Micractinium sp. CCAP 211/92]
MAGGGVVLNRASMANIQASPCCGSLRRPSFDYHGRLTFYVILVAAVAAAGGLLFGYDIGVTGGVEAFDEFQVKFFPDVYANRHDTTTSPYCVYDSQKMQAFTSSLFLAGLFSSLFAAKITQKWGRKMTMTLGSIWFLIGVGLTSGAVEIGMLVVGRLCLGFGIGFVNQVAPLYLSEMAPYNYRGGLNVCFQLCITIGILFAQLINYGMQNVTHGWRISLAVAGGPAIALFIGSLLLPESPNSLVERGRPEQARRVLERLRGTPQVDAEFNDIVLGVESSKGIRMREAGWEWEWGVFYVPVLFSSLGTGRKTALINTVVIGAVNVGCTIIAVLAVDRFGRRFLLVEGGIQCCIMMIIVGVVLGVEFSSVSGTILPKPVARGVLAVICLFIAGFAWSWGPLGWLVPSEIQPLETRSAGTAAAVVSNFLWTFVVGQVFLTMLCSMRFGVFLFFAGMLAIMTAFALFFVPETKGLPVERIQVLFARHWFWRRWMGEAAAEDIIAKEASRAAARKGFTAEHGAGLPAGPTVARKTPAPGIAGVLERASQFSSGWAPTEQQFIVPGDEEEVPPTK